MKKKKIRLSKGAEEWQFEEEAMVILILYTIHYTTGEMREFSDQLWSDLLNLVVGTSPAQPSHAQLW
jgi:hypothetical protein